MSENASAPQTLQTATPQAQRPEVKAVLLSPQRPLGSKPLLVVGCSLGTSSVLWEAVGLLLGGEMDVVAWDLPGHGVSPAAQAPFTVAGLADAVVAVVDCIAPGTRFHYAGVSLGGAVGLQLGIDHGARLLSLSVQCSGAKIGTPEGWAERAGTVRSQGTPVMIQGSAQRWFAEGFMDRDPALASRLLHSLRDADRFSYAYCCDALAAFDVRGSLGRITVPVLAVAGAEDQVAPPELAQEIVDTINARASEHTAQAGATADNAAIAVTLPNVSHLAPAEAPAEVARLLRGLMERDPAMTADPIHDPTDDRQGPVQPDATQRDVYEAGMAVRREVLGNAHVDRANAAADSFTRDFQEMITRIAWGGIWTRPGLSRQMRSAVTITAMVAHGHWEELAMHLKAALGNGLSRDEIQEILLQTAIYCGVPAANTAFKTAQEVFALLDADTQHPSRKDTTS